MTLNPKERFHSVARAVARALRPDGEQRKRFVNIAHLLTGNFLGSLLGLAAFALSARALGVYNYGQLALIISFTRVVERVVSFQSWQPIIKYGAHLEADRHDDLRALLKFGLLLDMGAAICAWVVAIAAARLIAPLFGWNSGTLQLLVLYSSVLLFQVSGMPTAVQRLAGNFRMLAYGQLANAILRVALCFFGAAIGAGLPYFAAVWAGTQILGSLTLLAVAMYALRRQGVRNIFGASLKGVTSRFPGIWSFAWSSNLSLTLRMSAQEFDTLLVGALADPGSAGLYHIAKRIGRVGQQVGQQVQAVVYPDIARLWAQGQLDKFKQVILQVEGMLLGAGLLGILLLWALIHPLLLWTAGPQFLAAAPLVIVQMVAVALVLSGSAARAALLAMGRQREVLRIVAFGTVVFHATAILLIPSIGAMGGNVAHVLLGTLMLAGLGFSLHRALKSADPLAPDTSAFNRGFGRPGFAAPEET